MAKKIAININFDSLYWLCGGDVEKFKFPSYFSVADRFFSFSEKYGFKYSIFVIGQDLQNKEVFARVRSWSEAGHEIGNHSWSHVSNLGILSDSKMEYEVMKSHELITQCTGKEPRGFIAPSWCASRRLLRLLAQNNYLYDTSIFPTYFIFALWLKLRLNSIGTSRKHNIRTKQLFFQMPFSFGKRTPYIKEYEGKKIVELPMPTAGYLRLPCWHTMNFVFGSEAVLGAADKILKISDNFYYVVHPADLQDYNNDLNDDIRGKIKSLERTMVPLEKKKEYMENVLRKLQNEGEFVTLEKMAGDIKNNCGK